MTEAAQPFAVDERRVLKIDAEKIDPKYLLDDKAPHIEAVCRAQSAGSRYYTVDVPEPLSSLRIRLNEPCDDEAELTEIVEELLSCPEEG